MSKIKFNHIDSDTLEVKISKDAPLEMVEQLTKSLVGRGLEEDVANSTLSVRVFRTPQRRSIEDIADRLIKSLMAMKKDDGSGSSMSPTERRRKMMAESQGIEYKPNMVVPNVNQSFTGRTAIPETPEQTNIDRMNELKKPAPNLLPKKAASDITKSDYGPKKAKLYNQADNERRKANNVGDVAGEGPNKNVKAYSTKPGQLSAKAQAGELARKQAKMNKDQPVKVFSQEEKDALARRMGLKKGWTQHAPIPNADEEVINTIAADKKTASEGALANQLANLMSGRSMLGQSHIQPTSEQMIAAGQSMGLVPSNEIVEKTEAKWNNSFNNWLIEASKPISQHFSSEQDEKDYWASIKVEDRDDGRSGY